MLLTLPALMLQVLPVGLRGLALAGLLAALMSSLSSTFNSSAPCSPSTSTRSGVPRRPSGRSLAVLTFATTAKGEITYTRTDVVASAIVLTFILSLYVYFFGLFF
jgi:Na+/proline symporter